MNAATYTRHNTSTIDDNHLDSHPIFFMKKLGSLTILVSNRRYHRSNTLVGTVIHPAVLALPPSSNDCKKLYKSNAIFFPTFFRSSAPPSEILKFAMFSSGSILTPSVTTIPEADDDCNSDNNASCDAHPVRKTPEVLEGVRAPSNSNPDDDVLPPPP
mmetsp:Transcript_16145/g.19116  ORF Transcript_16145/g.19116 Transcript_16145/m.19116 type:complete len:158 (-) Transcript_16145:432-905(-)